MPVCDDTDQLMLGLVCEDTDRVILGYGGVGDISTLCTKLIDFIDLDL